MKTKPSHHKQSGAALLAFMLVLVTGTSYLLVNKLNNYSSTTRDTQTYIALHEAKRALLSYAMNYPELRSPTVKGPGFLPCPDQNNDGNPTICGNSVTTTMRLGRLPFRILGLTDLQESGAERLWYAVSDNFKNTLSNDSVINSETPGLITVDTEDDIVAVIIAPGTPICGQYTRDVEPSKPSNYLEGGNETAANGYFVTTPPDADVGTDECDVESLKELFNDQLVTITRQELMEVVEKRVINEIRAVLANYYNDYGAYPWMKAFSDPKADQRRLTGYAGAASSVLTLDDNTQDFSAWGVATGDIVYNLTDGSRGVISAINDPTSITVSSLLYGTNNAFNEDDRYVIVVNSSASTFSGTAGVGSSGLSLVDNSKDFKGVGVTPGDVIDNLDDGSSGMVTSVLSTQLTVNSLNGGASNSFTSGDNYLIRNNTGIATAGAGLFLKDTTKDFNVMGIRVGDLIVNITDGSMGVVNGINTDTTDVPDKANDLTVAALNFGADNKFESNDFYFIPRYNADSNSREGLLAFHEAGKYYRTGFSFDWGITELNGATVTTDFLFPTINDTAYQTALTNQIEGALQVEINIDDGQCNWLAEQFIDCSGIHKAIFGTVTSGTDSANLVDSTKDFITYGIKPGDVIQNYDDTTFVTSGIADAGSGKLLLVDTDVNFCPSWPTIDTSLNYNFVITKNGDLNTVSVVAEVKIGPNANECNTIRLIPAPEDASISFSADDTWEMRDPQKLVVANVTANDTIFTVQTNANIPDFDGGLDEYYRILTATSNISGTADGASSGNFLEDTTADFSNIETGDIIENIANGSFGRISSIPSNTTLVATLYLPTDPATSTTTNFDVGDNYIIHYDYVGIRRYEIKTRYSGTSSRVYATNEVRKRDVCIGYEDASSNPDCSTIATMQATTLPSNNNVPTVTITDVFDITENTAAIVTVTIPTAGSTSGSMKVSDVDYYLHEASGELPVWFLKNKWHQLIYVAYSADYVPGGANDCETPVNNCLTLKVQRPYGTEVNNTRKALVMAASKELEDNVTCVVSGNVTKSGEGTLLINSDAAFKKDSIIPGDTVLNLIDGSTAQVVSVDSDTEITTTALVGGTSNKWNLSNVYQFSKTEKQDRAMAKLSSYYEFENCNRGNDEFDKSNITDSFNDQISVIDP